MLVNIGTKIYSTKKENSYASMTLTNCKLRALGEKMIMTTQYFSLLSVKTPLTKFANRKEKSRVLSGKQQQECSSIKLFLTIKSIIMTMFSKTIKETMFQ